MGKTRGKASCKNLDESHRFLHPREGKHDTAATAREEGTRACPHSRRALTPLGILKKFPDILVSTREEARESRPHAEEPRFRFLDREEGTFPAWSGKNFRRFRHISRGGGLHRKGERNSRVVPTFPESPRYLSPFQGKLFSLHCLDFQAEDRLTPRRHVGQPCGKASWESLVGKPRGKAPDP